MIKVQHGQIEHPENEFWYHSRHCDIHGNHGPLYICHTYSRSLKNNIKKLTYQFKEAIKDRKIHFINNNEQDQHKINIRNIDDIFFKESINETQSPQNDARSGQDILECSDPTAES